MNFGNGVSFQYNDNGFSYDGEAADFVNGILGFVNGYMKELLLKVIEYHAHALHGDDYDTWHNGRFIERWAEPYVVKEFGNIYAGYSQTDIWKALDATMNLFRIIVVEAAEKWGYQYPNRSDNYASEWFQQI
jgi:aminoglycoside 6-adenylyltransferase